MRLYNTPHRKVEKFRPLGNVVKIYTCGPTVYSFPHIGNYTSYIYWDLLIRVLRADGYAVRRVLNLTDVGHLVSDGDDGEDKMEKGARREGRTVWEVADFYIKDFLENFHALELVEPDKIARATDYIEEDKLAVKTMAEHGFTYETSDGIYFDTSKFPKYANFAKLDIEGLKLGARVKFSDEKRNPADFAVWKYIAPGEKHEMRWDFLGRPGYPGWHLECSTIIHEELGEPIDIHTGGIDHLPVHHTNEIAQSFAVTGKELSRYWLHCNFITIDGEKISKSLGNVYLLSDLIEKGYSPMDFKMWVLQGHYQGTRNFTFDGLDAARRRRLNWRNRIALAYQEPVRDNHEAMGKVLAALNDNLNSPEAFAVIDGTELSLVDWQKIDELFGLRLIADTPDVSGIVAPLVKERAAARATKNYARADEIRGRLAEQGISLRDTANGARWEYLK